MNMYEAVEVYITAISIHC